MVQCLLNEGWADPSAGCRPGEVWIRWGLDGVPTWGRNFLTLSVYVGAGSVRQQMHSATGFGLAAVQRSGEARTTVKTLLEACSWSHAMHDLEGFTVEIEGTQYRCRNFLLGDHMVQYKVTGASGPGIPVLDVHFLFRGRLKHRYGPSFNE